MVAVLSWPSVRVVSWSGPASRIGSREIRASVELPPPDRNVVPAALEVRLVQPPPWWIGEIEVSVAVRSVRQPDYPALAGMLAHRKLGAANRHADATIVGAVGSRGVKQVAVGQRGLAGLQVGLLHTPRAPEK